MLQLHSVFCIRPLVATWGLKINVEGSYK
jgi:hypothetical protein